ncbi:MAG: hypothetical protein GEU28_04965 [Dehalococcoidia bacterium]|nr:hypothetical protein [Dehalococcoidia bacterium]
MDALVGGLTQVFTFPAFALMLLGIVIGFLVGILPGLGGPTALALMLPFIFEMEPVEAFAFLLGMAAVTATTGDITSVLFGVPGEGTSAATVIDGRAMARRGQAGRALGAALMSSLVGAILGAFLLAASVPIIRPLVLTFETPELFALALLGLTFVAALSGRNLFKGVIAAGLGLMIATVGLDPQSATQRYTFGELRLWDGVGLVPAVVGLYAIPEVIDLWARGATTMHTTTEKISGVWQGVKDTFAHWGVTVRCSVIGMGIGVLPGMGAAIAQWVAYAHAQQSAKDKSEFGKGDVRGVLGPGAANNSGLGGSLIPAVAFGVPGSVTTAILLGAFIIQGLQPGPAMLRGDNLEITFSLVWIIVVANIITVGACLLFIDKVAKIAYAPVAYLVPAILLMVLLGGYAERNAVFDIGTTFVFGLLGLAMLHLDWPRPPLLLGLVLGPLIERNLFISHSLYGVDFITRPIVVIVLVSAVLMLLLPVVRQLLAKRFGIKEDTLVSDET